ncbi:MAG: hypothetical protein C3F18_11310, partial [Nitrosomonadales bacterium]
AVSAIKGVVVQRADDMPASLRQMFLHAAGIVVRVAAEIVDAAAGEEYGVQEVDVLFVIERGSSMCC